MIALSLFGQTLQLTCHIPSSAGVLEGMPKPKTLPAWLGESDLDYYFQAYKRAGFRGALNLYRNLDRDWKELPQVGATGLKQPTFSLAADVTARSLSEASIQ